MERREDMGSGGEQREGDRIRENVKERKGEGERLVSVHM